jgi:hypothetical protein
LAYITLAFSKEPLWTLTNNPTVFYTKLMSVYDTAAVTVDVLQDALFSLSRTLNGLYLRKSVLLFYYKSLSDCIFLELLFVSELYSATIV